MSALQDITKATEKEVIEYNKLCIKKYLEHMTNNELDIAVFCGYLDENYEVTKRALIELSAVALRKKYIEPEVITNTNLLDSLFSN